MIILDVPSVGGRFMLVDMAGSKNIEAAGQTGFEAKMQDSFEDDKSKILMIHFGIGHNMASGNKENQLLEMKQQCPPNSMLHIDLEVISWKTMTFSLCPRSGKTTSILSSFYLLV